MTATLRLPGSVAEVDASPRGAEVGAFFDLDGTLIAGYSARYLAQDRMRSRDLSVSELMRTVAVAVGAGLGRAGFEDLLKVGAEAWRGRATEDLEEMGERLDRARLVGAHVETLQDGRRHDPHLAGALACYEVCAHSVSW